MLEKKHKSDIEWKYFLRQLLICSGPWCCNFMFGISIGGPTVIIPQIRKLANSTEAVSAEMAAWLPAVINYGGIPWVFILPMLLSYFGRRIAYIVACLMGLIGFIISYTSAHVYEILIGEIFQGPVVATYFTTGVMIIAEYTSAKYRGLFLSLNTATFFWGVLVANTIGTFFYWKNIAILGISCSIYNLLNVFCWPESPYWLANKGRFDQCSKSHRWLKGSSIDSETELDNLTRDNITNNKKVPITSQALKDLKGTIKSEFYVPVLLSILLKALSCLSGKFVLTVYSLVIIKKMTSSESDAYTGMLILDAITVFCMYFGCYLSKRFKRRIILLTTSTLYIIFLLLLSLYNYLLKLMVINENKYISLILLMCYSITVSCGPMILCSTISGELIPRESRSIFICFIALFIKVMNGTLTKLSPYGIQLFSLHGMFFFFGLSSFVCLILIYIYVPETKDKPLHEIYDNLKKLKPIREAMELLPTIK